MLRNVVSLPGSVWNLLSLLLSKFGLLAALNFQISGMVTAYKIMELKRNLSLAAYLSARKTYLHRKKISLQARRAHRFPESLVLFNLASRSMFLDLF